MDEKNQARGARLAEVMTLLEVARHLKVSEKTILRMIQSREIPAAKVSNQWRFQRAVIDAWLNERTSAVGAEHPVNEAGSRWAHNVSEPGWLSPTHIVLNVRPGSKESVIRQLVAPLVAEGLVGDGEKYVQALLEREQVVSTAVADGVALPHVHDPESGYTREMCITFGLCPEGTDFDSLDGRPTTLFFLLAAKSAGSHLRLLAKVAMMLKQPGTADALRKARSRQELMAIFVKANEAMAMRR